MLCKTEHLIRTDVEWTGTRSPSTNWAAVRRAARMGTICRWRLCLCDRVHVALALMTYDRRSRFLGLHEPCKWPERRQRRVREVLIAAAMSFWTAMLLRAEIEKEKTVVRQLDVKIFLI